MFNKIFNEILPVMQKGVSNMTRFKHPRWQQHTKYIPMAVEG